MSNTQNPHSSGFNKINLIGIFLIFLTGCGGNYTEQVSKVVGKTKYLAPAEGNELTQGFENITLNSQGILEFKSGDIKMFFFKPNSISTLILSRSKLNDFNNLTIKSYFFEKNLNFLRNYIFFKSFIFLQL